MPLNRYQIRNEYSLADPELYKSADKDDPEALLEGVAMAGLVGVLRQLGDLAEFAAEIFHDLHEEVMATAARGHSLTVRVQQLEADFPLIERAFLSQTNHSSFFYNAGTDWHPNQRLDQNMVTRGDLPRFVMDSYEECRGPPRLFLLDKFDVAGAGACLKRYTDPSFFKVETSSFAFTTSDVQREKKTRKTKKRGSRWRNGETPEVLPTSHAKLHQLFLEERIENGIKVPSHRVKLKRKMNGFPFDPKTGKSYMNKFLEVTSPDHKVVHEICVDSPLRLPSTDAYETITDTEVIRPPSPDKEAMLRKKIAFSSPSPTQSEESNTLKPCLGGVNEEDRSDYEVREFSRPSHSMQSTNILPSTHSVVDEKEIAMDGENQIEGSVGYESDDVASEVDNYVDALATMDSELDTDSERRAKRDLQFLNSKRQVFGLSSSGEKLQAQSSDSTHSVENSTLSEDGNSYSKKEISSFSCSDSPSASAASILSESEISCKEAKATGTSVNDETQLPQPAEHGDYDRNCIMLAWEPSFGGDSGEPTTSLIVTDSAPMPVHDNAGIFMEGSGMIAETSEKFVSDDKSKNPLTIIAEDATNLHVSPPGTLGIRNDTEHVEDNSPSRASIEDKLADDLVDENFSLGEKVSYASYPSDFTCRASNDLTELPWSKSPKIHHETKSNNDLPFTSELLNVPSQDGPELLSSDNQHLHNLNGEDPLLGEDSTFLHKLSHGSTSVEEDISPSLLAVNLPNHQDGLDNENSNGMLGASEKECQSWLTMSHDKSAEDMCTSNPENLTTTKIEAGNADEEHEETNGAFSYAATFEQEDLNMNSRVHGPDFIDAPSPQILEIENDIQPFESGNVETSCSRQENVVEASSITFEENDINETIELLSARTSADLITFPQVEPLTKEAVLSDATQNNIDRSDVTAETASFADSADKGDKDDLLSSLDRENLSEESVCLIGHSSQNEVELDHTHLPDCLAELKFEKPIADSPDFYSFVHDTSSYHHPESEVPGTLSADKISAGAEDTLVLNGALSRPLDTEQLSSQGKSIADSTEAASLTLSLEEQKNELEDNQLNEELMDKADVNMDQSPLMEQIQPSSHVDGAFDAPSQSFPANLPSHDAVPDVVVHSSNQPQPSLTDYCAEERTESAIYEHDKMEILDCGETKSEPLALLGQSQQVDAFDLEQSAGTSSISLPAPSPSEPSFVEILSLTNQDNLSSLPSHHPDKAEDDLECEELDKERSILERSIDEGAAEKELLPQFDEAHLSNHADVVGALNDSSIPLMANVPSQPSVSIPLPLSSHSINPFENSNTMISTSPGVVLVPGESSIDLAEVPPLPPLPPIQWRMGKLNFSPDLDGEPTLRHTGFSFSSLTPRTSQNAQPVNHNMGPSALATESSELIDTCSENVAQSGPLTSPPTTLHGNGSIRFIDPVDKHSMNSHFPLPGQYHEVQQPDLHALRGEEAEPIYSIPNVSSLDQPSVDALGSSEDITQPRNQVAPELHSKEQGSASLEGILPIIDGIKPKGAPQDTGLTDASESMHEEPSRVQSQYQHHPLHQLAPETGSNKSNQEETPTSLERNVVTHGSINPLYTEQAKPDHSIPTTEAEIIWPAVEEGNSNGIRPVKLQRPRTPLIDDLATHDKSKLRKVTERVRPDIEKVDERDSVLQLRKVTERERVKPEIEKVDERDSVLQLRKVTQRVRPEIEKVDERDSLLEQIRKKSFNLKPAVATRPSIQGPQTNLRVAAILEKAKTIRQAFAGSDEEDDEDSWSDS